MASDSNDLFIVDDDAMMRDALSRGFHACRLSRDRIRGWRDISGSGEHADTGCRAARSAPAGQIWSNGAEKAECAQSYPAPIFIVTGDGAVSSAVEAVKSGAFDYLVKPLDARSIVARVRSAVMAFARRDGSAAGKIGLTIDFPGQSRLTPREREVLTQIAEGASNKEVGRHLGISPRTVEVHRARIMEKIGARNAADLVRIVLSGGDGRALSISEMTA